MIPRILHQTWKPEDLPEALQGYRASWMRHHPGWECRLYDDDACRRLVKRWFPDLLSLYDAFPRAIQRADLFRYLAVFREGGLYADLDMECLRNHDALLEGAGCVFGVETLLSPRRARIMGHGNRLRIANCIFAAEPGHPLIARIIEQVQRNGANPSLAGEVIENTGPGMVTDVFHRHGPDPSVRLLPRICWLPPARSRYAKRRPWNLHVHAMHHFMGSWKARGAGLPCEEDRRLARLNDPDQRRRLLAWTLVDPWEWIYLLPPCPIWKEDLTGLPSRVRRRLRRGGSGSGR